MRSAFNTAYIYTLMYMGNLGCTDRLGNEMLQSSAMVRDLGSPGQHKVECDLIILVVPFQLSMVCDAADTRALLNTDQYLTSKHWAL